MASDEYKRFIVATPLVMGDMILVDRLSDFAMNNSLLSYLENVPGLPILWYNVKEPMINNLFSKIPKYSMFLDKDIVKNLFVFRKTETGFDICDVYDDAVNLRIRVTTDKKYAYRQYSAHLYLWMQYDT